MQMTNLLDLRWQARQRAIQREVVLRALANTRAHL